MSTPRSRSLPVFLQWIALGALVGVVCGAASALFLASLESVTRFRSAHETLVFALPFAGFALAAAYGRYGKSVAAGNGLIIDTIHDDGPEIPLRMAPMVLLGTLTTHLFGGSAGREGTAVQIGASLTDWIAHRFRLAPAMRRQLLAAGVAGGFGSVFGTPIAGTIFGLELVVLGRLEYRALVPALVAAIVGDGTTRALGIEHSPYPSVAPLSLTPLVLGKWVVFAVAVAAAAVAFIELTHAIRRHGERLVPSAPARAFVGGLAVVGAWLALGTSDYLGLGVPTILRAFHDPTLPAYAFATKLVLTAITIGAGFLGGEVTPLFFVGATLGNLLARLLGLPLDLAAGVGMAALFAAASNTPLALSIMAVELLGGAALPHVVIVAVLAYVLTGDRSIYPAQRSLGTKAGRWRAPTPLREPQPEDEPL